MRTRRATSAALAALLLTSACALGEAPDEIGADTVDVVAVAADLPTVIVHKTESCECCGVYEDYLEDLGVPIEVEIHEDIGAVKDAFRVPQDEWSCHTNEVEGYVIEGHVPAEAIAALLEQAPDVDGIALAGMPPGSPGMPGEQTAPFVVTTFVDGEVVGELGRF